MSSTFFDRCFHYSGDLNVRLFNFFFYERFEEGWKFFNEISAIAGDLSPWNLNDLMMAHCCAVKIGINPEAVLAAIPPPPDREEFDAIANYQSVFAARVVRESNAPFLSGSINHNFNKAVHVGNVGHRLGKKIFVETGTFMGLTPYTLSNVFESIFTVEASPLLHQVFSSFVKSKKISNITPICGNSGEFLAQFKNRGYKSEDIVFFLDAHHSTGLTSKEYGFSPLAQEFQAITRDFPHAAIVVDDTRAFGEEGYPTVQQLLSMLKSRHKVEMNYDQMIVTSL